MKQGTQFAFFVKKPISEDIITPKCTESLVSAIPANYQPGTNAPSQEELNDDTGPSSQNDCKMTSQNENYVVWAEDNDNIDVNQLFSMSSTSLANETIVDVTVTNDKENVANASAITTAKQQPLSLFHPKRKRALAALKHSSKARKVLSPFSSNMERSLQQRRIQRRTQLRFASVCNNNDDKDEKETNVFTTTTTTTITTVSLSKESVCSSDISKVKEEDLFGDIDDSYFDGLDDPACYTTPIMNNLSTK